MDIDGAARHRITSLHFLLHYAAVMLTYFPDPIVSVKEASPWSGPNFFLRGTTCNACDPLLVLPKCSLPLASAFVGWSPLACELIGLSGRWKSLWGVEWSGELTRKTRYGLLFNSNQPLVRIWRDCSCRAFMTC